MNKVPNSLMLRPSVFVWIALITGLHLFIPLITMQFTSEVSRDKTDFIAMGLLLFSMGIGLVLVSEKVSSR